jgi:hypothetical protein
MMMSVEQWVESELAGETCPNATLSTIKPTWPDPCSNPGPPATNRLSYGTAHVMAYNRKYVIIVIIIIILLRTYRHLSTIVDYVHHTKFRETGFEVRKPTAA